MTPAYRLLLSEIETQFILELVASHRRTSVVAKSIYRKLMKAREVLA